METLLIIVHVVVCLFLIGIVLLQHGKGADIGATFGGSSQSLFGTEGPLPLLNKITTLSAVIFMVTSVALAYIASQNSAGSVMSRAVEEKPPVESTVEPQAQTVVPEGSETAPAVAEPPPAPAQQGGETPAQ
ncbi:preprotein translocase subunit SecG [Desulfofustis limnaeus]|uniref:Protein-export membrane protein SecG n=1 Tax=Desulfofustis limnaeus TaxID=2740163 RepID=A0ABM7WC61_9BACT|nr:preprotein translocase subunit SecG [Desulfofustis limnaeus]BDD88560.1 preprotein translocase subunit SecG [Desulfofustis limnaeus]